MMKMPKILLISSLLPLAFISAKVFATGCSFGSPEVERIMLPNFAIDPNLPVGSIIASKTISKAGIVALTCTGSTRYISTMQGAWSTESTVVPGVYETGLPGIGVKVSDYITPEKYVPQTAQLSPNMTTPLMGNDIRLNFYRTGKIVPGNFPVGQVANFSLPGKTGAMVKVLTLQLFSGGARIKSCYAKNVNIVIQLGRHGKKEFTGIGSGTAPKLFNVDLVCQGDRLPVEVSFDPSGGSDSYQDGVIPLDGSENSATGIAIKVMNRDASPLQFGVKRTYHTNAESSISIPLLANYIQTEKIIKPGLANSAMTFTITQN